MNNTVASDMLAVTQQQLELQPLLSLPHTAAGCCKPARSKVGQKTSNKTSMVWQ